MFKNIVSVVLFAAVLFAGCTRFDEPRRPDSGDNSERSFRFAPMFTAENAQTIVSRAVDIDYIDDVYMFIFKDTNNNSIIDEADELEFREYYEYGKTQNIYLKRGDVYFVYAVANLDNSNIPEGKTVGNYFDDVDNYGKLLEKYLQIDIRTPDDTGKMIMTTDNPDNANLGAGEIGGGIIKVEFNGSSNTFGPDIPMYRIQAKFIVKIYNKVGSGVMPLSLTGSSFPRYSHLVRRATDFADRNGDGVVVDAGDDHYTTSQIPLPVVEGEYRYPDDNGPLYALQTMEFYCFENRRGTSDLSAFIPTDPGPDGILGNGDDIQYPAAPKVYGRYALAPSFSSYLMLLSLTEGDVMRTFINAGKGRTNPDPAVGDNINDYNVDRNCIYTFNVIINSADEVNVKIDTRREFLSQRVVFEYPADSRVDAHYVDMPSYISGNKPGIAKLQAGTVPESSVYIEDGQLAIRPDAYEDGVPIGWEPMTNANTDANWLRLSWIDPYKPMRESLVTRQSVPEPTTSTLYVEMAMTDGHVDGYSSATPILHFSEFVKKADSDPGVFTAGDGVDLYPPTTAPATNPPRRIAAIRVGFFENILTADEYEQKVNNNEDEFPFFRPIAQYGLKTIGQIGGWDKDLGYTSMLGVESIEETTVVYYRRKKTNSSNTPLHDYYTSGGPYWTYGGSYTPAWNHSYDGRAATISRYNAYAELNGYNPAESDSWDGPVRWSTTTSTPEYKVPANVTTPAEAYIRNMYNPFFNTNAADYCMRKNRDEDGNGIIEGSEVKWYLPTPVQVMQMYTWRDAFRNTGSNTGYTLNRGLGSAGPPNNPYPGTGGSTYLPFGLSTVDEFKIPIVSGSPVGSYYWTSTETSEGYALAVDFSQSVGTFGVAHPITQRNAVRCVRDIPGQTETDVFYYSDGELAVDLRDYVPNTDQGKVGIKENDQVGKNTIAGTFLISRWYVTSGGGSSNTGANHTGNVTPASMSDQCGSYREGDNQLGWRSPSQLELSFIYAYAGMINDIFLNAFGTNNEGPTTYHALKNEGLHWSGNDVGSNRDYWRVDFSTGLASTAHKNNSGGAYMRCVRYIDASDLPSPQPQPQP